MGFEYLALALALLGLFMFAAGLGRLRHRRVVAGCTRCLGALVPLALAVALALVASNLHTYSRLTAEQSAALLTFERLGPQHFHVVLDTPDGRRADFTLTGDEWQVDARVLKWHGWANLAGLDTAYRLERLSGRYRTVEQELAGERTVISLAGDRGLDLWGLAHRHPGRIPLVDASYGSATYLPMADGARFEVRVTQSGLIARPENAVAESAVNAWR